MTELEKTLRRKEIHMRLYIIVISFFVVCQSVYHLSVMGVKRGSHYQLNTPERMERAHKLTYNER